mgnify:CR=1 FL=1
MSPSNFSMEDFISTISVSRETQEKLKCYADLLIKWNKAINLVGRDTIPDLWRRHFLDSAQLFEHLPENEDNNKPVIVDFGSGAGFPSLVLAIMGAGEVHAMESDLKKSTFLREVSRETDAGLIIHNNRIEKVEPFPVDVFTARAFAPLTKILDFAEPFLEVSNSVKNPEFLLLKGRKVDQELTEAEKKWTMKLSRYKSLSDPDAAILNLKIL